MGKDITVIPEVIEPLSNALDKNLPSTTKQTDETLAAVVGFFNNVVLYPVKMANISFKYKLEKFEEDIKEKAKSIPEEDIQVPAINISGPAMEALRYAYDEKELREMYENLLVSAMDKRKSNNVHPSFVQAINTMSPLDAEILQVIAKNRQLRCAWITFGIGKTGNNYANAMPEYFVEELADLEDPFIVSSSIINLQRLSFIKIWENSMVNADYQTILEHPYVLNRLEFYKHHGQWSDINVGKVDMTIIITDLGIQFSKICFDN